MNEIKISQLQPMENIVLVEPIVEENVTKSGIILNDKKEKKSQYGKVMAVGRTNQALTATARKSDLVELKVGETVYYKDWSGHDLVVGEKEYKLLDREDVLAVVK